MQHNIFEFRSACTSIKLLEDVVIAAYGSGHIRMFLVREPILLCEVAAHARWITALDVAPESRLALTVAEDSFVRVWQIEKNADEVVSIDGNKYRFRAVI